MGAQTWKCSVLCNFPRCICCGFLQNLVLGWFYALGSECNGVLQDCFGFFVGFSALGSWVLRLQVWATMTGSYIHIYRASLSVSLTCSHKECVFLTVPVFYPCLSLLFIIVFSNFKLITYGLSSEQNLLKFPLLWEPCPLSIKHISFHVKKKKNSFSLIQH